MRSEKREFVRSSFAANPCTYSQILGHCQLEQRERQCIDTGNLSETHPSHGRKPFPSLLELRRPTQNRFREFCESIPWAIVALCPSVV